MKRVLYIAAIALLAGLVSCQQDVNLANQIPASEPDMVEVSFNVQFPELLPVNTKGSMAEYPDADDFNVYLCLYGSGDGYVQNWIPAKTVSITPGTNNTKGSFVVKLPITDEKRTVHIIVNPPFADDDPPISDYIYNVLEKMVTEDGECSYWQEIVLEDGIQAHLEGNTWVPDRDLVNAFSDIHLIRNFAKVSVTGNPNEEFTVGRWTLINVPTKAYVAPYNGETTVTFPKGYTNIAAYETGDALLAQLMGTDLEHYPEPDNYPGYFPPVAADESIIDESFPSDLTKYATAGNSQYMYERPLPVTGQPQTAVLVEITFGDHLLTEQYNELHKDEEGFVPVTSVTYWYKVELLNSEGHYLPILRNISYVLKIEGVETAGSDSAEEAYNDTYFGNISASLETASLTNLSNGESLIHVDQLDYTFFTSGEELLMFEDDAAHFWFIPNIEDNIPYFEDNDEAHCTVDVEIISVSGHDPAVTAIATNGDAAGDGTIKVTLADVASGSMKKSIIRVTGTNTATNKTLYREIMINLMGTPALAWGEHQTDITSMPDSLIGPNLSVGITVYLPDELGASLFPIQLRIEAENNSLSATSIDLPVSTGPSVYDPSRNTYFFIKTIKYSEYRVLNPRTKKYDYTNAFPITLYTSKAGDNSTKIDIRDLAGLFQEKELTLEIVNNDNP